jgi:hypothetical protein
MATGMEVELARLRTFDEECARILPEFREYLQRTTILRPPLIDVAVTYMRAALAENIMGSQGRAGTE